VQRVFPDQWNGAEFIAKYFKPYFFWFFSYAKKRTINKKRLLVMDENKFDNLFNQYGLEYHIDPLLLKAQVKQESNFNPNAVNKISGAKGLAQFMDRTWEEWCDLVPGIQKTIIQYNPFNPDQAIHAQSAYMSFLKKIIEQKLVQTLSDKDYLMHWALAAYNWGIGNIIGRVVKGKVKMGMIQFAKFNYEFAEKYLPKETSNYVIRIMKYYCEYQQKEYDNAKQ
jgi:soluble lytic murein transglycosylase-like protein